MVVQTHTGLLFYGARSDTRIVWSSTQVKARPAGNRSHYNFAAGLLPCLPYAQVINAGRGCRELSSQRGSGELSLWR